LLDDESEQLERLDDNIRGPEICVMKLIDYAHVTACESNRSTVE